MPNPISKKYRFDYFSSVAEYESRTGKTAPPFDPGKPIQRFEPTIEPGKVYLALADVPGPDGNPALEAWPARAFLRAVNIPRESDKEIPAGPENPSPLLDLAPGEFLRYVQVSPVARVVMVFAPGEALKYQDRTDRQLLEGIAEKVGA